ncbi:DUF3732 domain-containing protein [Streptomyces sp. NPDC007157]|uniref:DUF3732 domain-containing protein n=1 Tax=Streptomyces sp. NPDC007157 TaxID=3154681 RepID=UPI0033D0D867
MLRCRWAARPARWSPSRRRGGVPYGSGHTRTGPRSFPRRHHRPSDPDRTALLDLYKTIQNTIEALGGDFQVIVMEHADLDDEPFRSSVEARWRRSNDQALVLQDWITEEIDDA